MHFIHLNKSMLLILIYTLYIQNKIISLIRNNSSYITILDILPCIRVLGRSGKLSNDDESSSCSSEHRMSFRNISINIVAATLVLLGGLERVDELEEQ